MSRTRRTTTAYLLAVALVAGISGPALASDEPDHGTTTAAEGIAVATDLLEVVPAGIAETTAKVRTSADGDTTTSGPDGAEIAVSADGGDGVVVTNPDGSRVEITADVPSDATGTVVNGITVFDLGSHAVSYQPVSPDAGGGIRTLFTLIDASSPTEYRVDFDLPAGARFVAQGDGGYLAVDSEGQAVGAVPAPWARDATGASVSTHFEVQGEALVQHVLPTSDTVFPVVADPFWIPAWAVAQIIRCGFGGALGWISSAGWRWYARALSVVGGCLLGMR